MRAHLAYGLALVLLALGCDAEDGFRGLSEPIVVQGAEFKEGKLPGSEEDDESGERRVTSLQANFGALRPGAPGLSVSGRTSGDAYAIAIRLEELGSGYWLRPVGSIDPTLPGELTFTFSFDVASQIEPGIKTLQAVAFDENGRAGQISTLEVCVGSDLPDNLNVCNPQSAPPPAIASLTWNADADVDLTIISPDGKRYDRNNRFLARDGKPVMLEDGKLSATLDADGSTGCLIDGRRRENFVWNEKPGKGTWLAYANLFDACGKAAVQIELTIYRSRRKEDGDFELVAAEKLHGEFVRVQQNGGVGTPLYLAPIQF